MRKKCSYGQKNLGQYVAVCPRLRHISHTQPTSTLSRIKCERYIFYKEVCSFVRSFVHWSSCIIFDYVSAYICICICMQLYNRLTYTNIDSIFRVTLLFASWPKGTSVPFGLSQTAVVILYLCYWPWICVSVRDCVTVCYCCGACIYDFITPTCSSDFLTHMNCFWLLIHVSCLPVNPCITVFLFTQLEHDSSIKGQYVTFIVKYSGG